MRQRREPDPETDRLAREVIGAAIEVHRRLGPGFLEELYEEALSVELRLRGISFERQVRIPIDYKGARVGVARLDLLVGGRVVVELKAINAVPLSYLCASGCSLGLLINFNVPVLRDGVQRLVRSVA